MKDLVGQVTDGWQVRIGIHTGPLVAGVIGRHQHLFDVWGDTVNTAARITSMAAPDTVFVSADTWQHLSGHCQGSPQGVFHAKGKGDLEVFKVDAIRER